MAGCVSEGLANCAEVLDISTECVAVEWNVHPATNAPGVRVSQKSALRMTSALSRVPENLLDTKYLMLKCKLYL